MNIYDFKVKNTEGQEVSLSDYKEKILLIVNTATGCGFTPQYKDLQELYKKYREHGFEILDFPCNQFGNQAPGTDAEIVSFCQTNFNTGFKQFSKIEVNGENADPLFKYLTENTKFEGFGMSPMGVMLSGIVKKMDKDYKNNGKIKWNFTKFLIDRNGNIVKRFEPVVSVLKIEEELKKIL